MPLILSPSFYQRDTETVAKKLLGKKLVRIYKGQRISGIIVETEAYLGIKDKAAHSYGGKVTSRTKTMYLPGGHSYVYFIYGMYHCLNVVTRTTKHPEAVLIRALEPVEGIELMKKFRKTENIKNLTSGPGKLCRALNIDKTHNALKLFEQGDLFIENGKNGHAIAKSARINIDYAEEAIDWGLRFFIKNNPHVSPG